MSQHTKLVLIISIVVLINVVTFGFIEKLESRRRAASPDANKEKK